jgi:hypothetical protein
MNPASVIFDLHDPRNAVLPFARRHPPGEVVAVEGGMGVRAYESVFDFHPLTIMDDPGIKQGIAGDCCDNVKRRGVFTRASGLEGFFRASQMMGISLTPSVSTVMIRSLR